MKSVIATIAAFAAPLGYLAYHWNTLPARIPAHFDAHGNVTRYTDKESTLITWLLFAVFVSGVTWALSWLVLRATASKADMGMGKGIHEAVDWLRVGLLLFFASLATLLLHYSLNPSFPLLTWIAIATLGMWLLIAWIVPKFPRNRVAGLRTPTTLADDESWTNGQVRFARYTRVGVLVVGVPSLFLGGWYALGASGLVLLCAGIIASIKTSSEAQQN